MSGMKVCSLDSVVHELADASILSSISASVLEAKRDTEPVLSLRPWKR